MPPGQLTARRLGAQLLAGPPAPGPTAVAERLLAVQAQDQRGFRLAIRVRSRAPSVVAVNLALSEDRSLVVTWLNRGTLHLVRAEDYRWLHALTTPPLRSACDRRLAQAGVTPDAAARGVGVIVRSLSADGPLSRDDLRSRLTAAGVPVAGQAFVHVLLRASIEGLIVRGPLVDGNHCYVLVDDWLGPGPAVDRDRALAELARRYLAGHGPAGEGDLAGWAGVGLGEARAGLRAIGAELDVLPGGLVDLAGRRPAPRLPPPRLLGPFDPLLHGYRDRTPLLGDNRTVVTSNGIVRPVLLVAGRAVATWTLAGGVVHLAPFRTLSDRSRMAARREASAIGRYLGLGPVTLVETPAPGP